MRVGRVHRRGRCRGERERGDGKGDPTVGRRRRATAEGKRDGASVIAQRGEGRPTMSRVRAGEGGEVGPVRAMGVGELGLVCRAQDGPWPRPKVESEVLERADLQPASTSFPPPSLSSSARHACRLYLCCDCRRWPCLCLSGREGCERAVCVRCQGACREGGHRAHCQGRERLARRRNKVNQPPEEAQAHHHVSIRHPSRCNISLGRRWTTPFDRARELKADRPVPPRLCSLSL